MSKRAREYMLPTDLVMWWVSMIECEDPAIPVFQSREEYYAFEQETRAKRNRIGNELRDAMRPLAEIASAFKTENRKLLKMKKYAVIDFDWPCGLPPELWLKIANNLDPLSFLTMTCTTRRWRELLISKESLLEYYRTHVSRWGVEAPKMLAAIDAFDEPKRLFNFSMILMQLAGTWVMHGALRPTGGIMYRPPMRSLEAVPFLPKGAIGFNMYGAVIYANGNKTSSEHDDLPSMSGERAFCLNSETNTLWDITGGFDIGINSIWNRKFPNRKMSLSDSNGHEYCGICALETKDAVYKIESKNLNPVVTKIYSYDAPDLDDPIGRVTPLVGDDGEIYSLKNTRRPDYAKYTCLSSPGIEEKSKIWKEENESGPLVWVPGWMTIGSSGVMSSYRNWRLEHSDGTVRIVSPESEVIFSLKPGLTRFCKIGPSGILLDNCCFFFFTFKAKNALNHG